MGLENPASPNGMQVRENDGESPVINTLQSETLLRFNTSEHYGLALRMYLALIRSARSYPGAK
jgi:hypothetical protein